MSGVYVVYMGCLGTLPPALVVDQTLNLTGLLELCQLVSETTSEVTLTVPIVGLITTYPPDGG